jgi:hypothetical protein
LDFHTGLVVRWFCYGWFFAVCFLQIGPASVLTPDQKSEVGKLKLAVQGDAPAAQAERGELPK